jgi:hypothetical protein
VGLPTTDSAVDIEVDLLTPWRTEIPKAITGIQQEKGLYLPNQSVKTAIGIVLQFTDLK